MAPERRRLCEAGRNAELVMLRRVNEKTRPNPTAGRRYSVSSRWVVRHGARRHSPQRALKKNADREKILTAQIGDKLILNGELVMLMGCPGPAVATSASVRSAGRRWRLRWRMIRSSEASTCVQFIAGTPQSSALVALNR